MQKHMLHEVINKDLEIIVAFGGFSISGGSIPEKHIGRLISIDEDYCNILFQI